MVNHTIIGQAWEHAKALGVLDLDLEDGKIVKFAGHLEEIKPVAGQEDKAIQQIVAKYSRKVDARPGSDRGAKPRWTWTANTVRLRETNLGDLVTDIMRAASRGRSRPDQRRQPPRQHPPGADQGQGRLCGAALR